MITPHELSSLTQACCLPNYSVLRCKNEWGQNVSDGIYYQQFIGLNPCVFYFSKRTTVQLSNPQFNQLIYCPFIKDKEASFPGGEKALMQFIYNNFRLNPMLKGKIITYFIIEKDGSLSNIRGLRGLTKESNDEAVKVIQSMPKWIPSIANGKAFRVAYTMPFIFN